MSKIIIALFLTGIFNILFSQENETRVRPFKKPTDKDQRQVVNVNNLQLTVTNYGVLGARNAFWPTQFSAEYPRYTRIEHLYQGGIYFGAISRMRGRAGVSTGCSDRSGSGVTGTHYEFSSEPGAQITKRSTDSTSGYPTEGAVSELDFVCDYTDKYTRDPVTADTIPYHMPLGITVRQESYAWNKDVAESFVIISYTFKNTGYRDPSTGVTVRDTLDSVYVGLWNNFVVRNTNFVLPGTSGYFNVAAGYDSSKRLAYAFDYDGNNQGPPANSYISMKILGSTPLPKEVDSLHNLSLKTYFNAWSFRSASGEIEYFSPVLDDEDPNRWMNRYGRMTTMMYPKSKIDVLRTSPRNSTLLLSTGPFVTMYPGDSLNVVFAIVAAKKYGPDLPRYDTPEQRSLLYTNADWAQKIYEGKYVNIPADTVKDSTNTPLRVWFTKDPLDPMKTIQQPETTYTVASFSWVDSGNGLTSYRICLGSPNDSTSWFEFPAYGTEGMITLEAPRSRTDNVSGTVDADVYIGTFPNMQLIGTVPGLRLDDTNRIYLQAKDITGEYSPAVSLPEGARKWFVKKPKSKLLTVSNYGAGDYASVIGFYRNAFAAIDTLEGVTSPRNFGNFDLLDIRRGATDRVVGALVPPILNPAFVRTLKLFEYVFWFTDYIPDTWIHVQAIVQNVLPYYDGKVLYSTRFGYFLGDPRGSFVAFAPLDSVGRTLIDTRIPNDWPIYPDSTYPGGFYPTLRFNPAPTLGGAHSLFVRDIYKRADARYILSIPPVPDRVPPNAFWTGPVNIGVIDEAKTFVFLSQQLHLMNGSEKIWPTRPGDSGKGVPAFLKKVFIDEFGTTSVKDPNDGAIPTGYLLRNNYPNPFNPNTTLRYQIPVESKVTLRIYNILGQEVNTLVNDEQSAGFKSIEWNSINNMGNAVASGVYFYRIEATSVNDPGKRFIQVKKMLLLR
ncbi:MAG: FlgD immunoglobulin-like domain containing protein [Bacteroidota bacterium]|nr:FlgD immunoglobulin-like domain containing protein [Bacteroidota bacterium]